MYTYKLFNLRPVKILDWLFLNSNKRKTAAVLKVIFAVHISLVHLFYFLTWPPGGVKSFFSTDFPNYWIIFENIVMEITSPIFSECPPSPAITHLQNWSQILNRDLWNNFTFATNGTLPFLKNCWILPISYNWCHFELKHFELQRVLNFFSFH